ncbi:MAG: transglycosylase SLT domain-containing protein [Bacteroidia bacterium]
MSSFFSAFAIKDSSDLAIDYERITRIEILSKGLYNKIHPTHCTKPGDDCKVAFENNKMPLSESEFIHNSKLLESGIPMQYNPEVSKLINYFGTSWQSKLKEMIVVSNYYFPIYEEIFDKYDMPLEIKYLSVIESALNPNATSKSGAAGLWQFMHATGKIFDLKVNNYVDERRNVEKSTEAACQYLKSMYARYGDWFLVIASYNCGPGNVNKAIRKSGGKRTFWEIYPFLPKETQNYVPAFIAMTYLMNFYDSYGITPSLAGETKTRLVEVVCNSEYCYQVICNTLDLTADQLRSFNPELKKTTLPGVAAGFNLNLPYEKALVFWQMEDSIDVASQRIKTWKAPVAEIPVATKSAKSSKSKTYKVKKGESLPAIAKKFDCKVWQLRSWNGLKSNKIYPGQKLIVKSS